jgi:4-azaleucine resistance transporter AzlC
MKNKRISAALAAAFPHTLPIMAGFLFLGMTYGVYARVSGLDFWYPMLMSLLIYAGSAEFVAVNLLLGAFDPLLAFFTVLMINARHLFYGVSLLEKYKGTGWKKPYLIFGLTDESFSINCSLDVPNGVDRGWFYFFITALNQCYWFAGASLGSLFGSFVFFNTEGLDFVMTAMFVVIFLEQWLKEKDHTASLLGIGLSVGCLLIFGADRFLLPTMAAILLSLTLLRKVLERRQMS